MLLTDLIINITNLIIRESKFVNIQLYLLLKHSNLFSQDLFWKVQNSPSWWVPLLCSYQVSTITWVLFRCCQVVVRTWIPICSQSFGRSCFLGWHDITTSIWCCFVHAWCRTHPCVGQSWREWNPLLHDAWRGIWQESRPDLFMRPLFFC